MNYNLESAIGMLVVAAEQSDSVQEKALYSKLISGIEKINSIDSCNYFLREIMYKIEPNELLNHVEKQLENYILELEYEEICPENGPFVVNSMVLK